MHERDLKKRPSYGVSLMANLEQVKSKQISNQQLPEPSQTVDLRPLVSD